MVKFRRYSPLANVEEELVPLIFTVSPVYYLFVILRLNLFTGSINRHLRVLTGNSFQDSSSDPMMITYSYNLNSNRAPREEYSQVLLRILYRRRIYFMVLYRIIIKITKGYLIDYIPKHLINYVTVFPITLPLHVLGFLPKEFLSQLIN